jgi:N6-adenosine-specific RNA methylase IME4
MIPFPDKKYQIIYADPPWHYKNYADNTASRWVGNQYPVMSVSDISELPVESIAANNSILFLWVTPPCLLDGLKVMQSWGFTYKTKGFCWIKRNKKAGSLFWGMGYWTRSNSEDCLIGVKGHPKRIDAGVHQVIDARWQAHSKKPDETRDRIVWLMGDLPRIELFARERVDGWDAWGNEV